MLALILLLAEFAISDRKRSRKTFPIIKTAYRRIPKIGRVAGATSVGVLVLLVILFLGFGGAHASPGGAETAYKAGDYDLAVERYRSEAQKSPEEPQLQFNLGAAAYKGKQYPEALTSFKRALNVQDIQLQNQSYYNMGNTLYRQGEETEKQNPQQTIQHWEASIQAYDNALKLKPEDQDAEFNKEFVKKRLEALKKDQKQKDCNNKDKNKDKKKNDNQKNQQANKKDSKQNQNKDQKPGQGSAKKDQLKPSQKQNQNQTAQAPKRRRPGKMSEEQAKNLLDSLKGDEKAMSMTARNTGLGGKPQDQKRRDW
jgi:Ca-activated chloride channel family protein